MLDRLKIPEIQNPFFGFGARGVVNVSRVLGIDAQFARNTHTWPGTPIQGQSVNIGEELTVNLKATWRRPNIFRVAPFAIAGAGFTRNGPSFSSLLPNPIHVNDEVTEFALRYGGGLEFRADRRLSLRLDVTGLASPYFPDNSIPGGWWHRLDLSLALMSRWGTMDRGKQ